jgi:hypothetical protein
MGSSDRTQSEGSTGTFGWKKVSMRFTAPSDGIVSIACRLGFTNIKRKAKHGLIILLFIKIRQAIGELLHSTAMIGTTVFKHNRP